MEWLAYLAIPMVASMLLTPVIGWIASYLDVFAQINERTIHKGKIIRIGGAAIYLAFLLTFALFTKGIDSTLQGLLLGSSIMFFTGLIDDMINMKPVLKFMMQAIAAMLLIVVGNVELGIIYLPFDIVINTGFVSLLITFVWIVGITNAINLIDGLDGLAAGVSAIVLVTIGIISLAGSRPDIAMLSFIIAGSTLGFLPWNFYPAKIFMGDCGALFLGFVIAAISLMGFKGSTFITLGFPILLLSVPIVDTLSAMLRRVLSGKSMSEADRGHLHHMLMLRFGHRNTVLIIYTITIAFGLGAYIYILNKSLGLLCVGLLFLGLEVFIEKTQMISKKYHPLTTVFSFCVKKITRQKK